MPPVFATYIRKRLGLTGCSRAGDATGDPPSAGGHMTNLGSLPNPPNPWTRAPKTISGWGYSALVLLSVAATGVSLFNGNMAALIITLVVMFGFFIALWALDRITRATRGFWQNFGRILSVVVVGAIALLFVEILVYIGTSYPAWLDVWFRPGYKVDAPSNLKLRPGAEAPSFRYAGRGLLVPRLVPFQTPLINHVRHPRGSACQMGMERPPGTTPDRTTSITVSWSPSVQQGTSVEISVRRKGEAGEFPEPVVTTPGEQGTARVTGLKPATAYEVKIVNVLRARRSAPEIGAIATDADLTPRGRLLSGTENVWESGFGQWSAYYTGALNADGQPHADFASMVFESWDDTAKHNIACWMYQGAFRGGLPHGFGKLSAMPEYCEGPQCGSTCNGTFKDGNIETASCALFLGGIGYPLSGAQQTLYGGPNRYICEVKGAWPASAVLGPLRVSFSGQGTLFASDRGVPGTVVNPYAETYSGVWEGGELKEGKKLTDGKISSIGNANTSIDIVSSKCILQVTSKRNENVVGPGALVSCARVEIGDFVRQQAPFRDSPLVLWTGCSQRHCTLRVRKLSQKRQFALIVEHAWPRRRLDLLSRQFRVMGTGS